MKLSGKKQKLETGSSDSTVTGDSCDEPKSILDVFDWSSLEESSSGESEIRYLLVSMDVGWNPISPYIFRKASRRWLATQSGPSQSSNKQSGSSANQQIECVRQMQALENYLSLVSMMYYGGSYNEKLRGTVSRSNKRARQGNPIECLNAILSPLRPDISFGRVYLECWSPKEVAVFECGLCMYGKKFDVLQKLLGESKNLRQISEFYYLWKQTSHYKAWKDSVTH
jgi:hypothetical protein